MRFARALTVAAAMALSGSGLAAAQTAPVQIEFNIFCVAFIAETV